MPSKAKGRKGKLGKRKVGVAVRRAAKHINAAVVLLTAGNVKPRMVRFTDNYFTGRNQEEHK